MNRIRIATFNTENLFTRPEFLNFGGRPSDRRIGMVEFRDAEELRQARRISEATLSRIERQLTAQVILDADADFVALQEVDDRAALELFRDDFLHTHLSPRLARALRPKLPALHAEAARLHGEEPDNPEQARVRAAWLEEALDRERRAIGRHLYYDDFDVIEGNDRRGIDLGFLSRLRPGKVTHYAAFTYDDFGLWSAELARIAEQDWRNYGSVGDKPDGSMRVFRRDVVAVDLDVGGKPLTIFNCHFKSNTNGPRDKGRTIREAEVKALAEIVRRRFPDPARGNWVLCGDFNDYTEVDGSPEMYSLRTGQRQLSTLGPLVDPAPGGLGAFDSVLWIEDPCDRWTTYYPAEDLHTSLDHIFLSPALAAANAKRPAAERAPAILRRGMSWSIPRGPERYPGVGINDPKASDHALIAITLQLP
ncbi:MAG: endonuclease/exonuclease/phosphatase family protein [Methylobacterium sp.]|nr:endonuclease/exonuclease/phosphatase family protein [Methylobacterium sp.]MCA3656905.1 endonuclease/exonuclease/phosphatase family protein [Methylobacterium sp.]MCA3661092.1 endonuclease/exonuclease/phosphatase family protein [Methylobacterium sp.]MCA3663185.1 endonuclease/exonuclease/phosphatase family protein [Methylobacterium sp.]MCA3671047.1 endonuclease/exonuclease/phosphatase family protein [Methylobacterium sp.]